MLPPFPRSPDALVSRKMNSVGTLRVDSTEQEAKWQFGLKSISALSMMAAMLQGWHPRLQGIAARGFVNILVWWMWM